MLQLDLIPNLEHCNKRFRALESTYDAHMDKQKARPSVTGEMNNYQMLKFAAGFGAVGSGLLCSVSPVSALLGVATIGLYAGPYTYLKRRHWVNTQVGAIVGAIPPLIGAAAKGGLAGMLSPESLCVAALLFLWQFPHFYALNVYRNKPYSRSHYHMLASQSSTQGAAWSFGSCWLMWAVHWYISTLDDSSPIKRLDSKWSRVLYGVPLACMTIASGMWMYKAMKGLPILNELVFFSWNFPFGDSVLIFFIFSCWSTFLKIDQYMNDV